VTHTLTLFFLAQVFGHLKKRDLAAIYCHLCLNRQLKQKKDFNRRVSRTKKREQGRRLY
jgi:hypothetical protein